VKITSTLERIGESVGDSEERRPPRWLRFANRVNIALLSRGIGPTTQRILTVAGRSSGLPRRTPIAIATLGGTRYIVAGYESADWVKNVRAAGHGTLTRGSAYEEVGLVELAVDERAPILREFLRTIRGGRSFVTASANASDAELRDAAERHPVFRLG
jgi:deazaflavin-dependent oxidoreductase (nitroreductase family)